MWDDVKQGIIASKIAAHAADIAKGIPGARDIDDRMSEARKNLDWDAQFECALDPETARAIRDSRSPEEDHEETCSMCGTILRCPQHEQSPFGGIHRYTLIWPDERLKLSGPAR